MLITDRIIPNKPLYFAEKEGYVVIGVNRINKIYYYQHQKTFNKIIKLGDEAWNKTIDTIELTAFINRLNEYQRLLQLT